MLNSQGLRALGYKKYALCELSNGKSPVMTCKKEQQEMLRSWGLSTTEKIVAVPYGTGSSFATRRWRLIADMYQAIWSGEGVLL